MVLSRYFCLCCKHVNKGEGVKNPQNHVNVVYEWFPRATVQLKFQELYQKYAVVAKEIKSSLSALRRLGRRNLLSLHKGPSNLSGVA